MSASRRFIDARDQLLRLREDRAAAHREFSWPVFDELNWASDYFDVIARGNDQPALRVVDDAGDGEMLTFAQLARRSSQVANWLTRLGVGHGDRILVMLGNVVALWETMLAAIRIGAVIIPATTLLEHEDLADRIARGGVRAVVAHSRLTNRFDHIGRLPVQICVGEPAAGWTDYALSRHADEVFVAARKTRANDLLFLYFTSGTTARPKLAAHTHASYPVGHLSTMYWIGLKPGDVHLNLSSPGWAKHAWSCFFAPWNAQACVLAYQYERFDSRALLDQLVRCRVTTFCAPPTVWRMLIQQDLRRWPVGLREVVSAGEPLNPEVIEQVRQAWGLTVRDGYGQTETAAQIGNSPGQPVKAGSMGLPLPGYEIVLRGADGRLQDEGEICIDLTRRPVGLMHGYLDDPERTAEALGDGCYRSGDVARRDSDGYLTYVGRMDDVFKCSDYRISPFELESVLIEHTAVAEAAVVPSPDPARLSVPKAFVTLAAGYSPDAATALSIFVHIRTRVSPYKRIRRLEFNTLPKTISGKIRRVDLRQSEQGREASPGRNAFEFWEEDFAELAPIVPRPPPV
jgi:acetyl-CoA synthetase